MFAYDTKCLKHVTNISDCHLLQEDILSLSDWGATTRISFNCTNVLCSDSIKHLFYLTSLTLLGERWTCKKYRNKVGMKACKKTTQLRNDGGKERQEDYLYLLYMQQMSGSLLDFLSLPYFCSTVICSRCRIVFLSFFSTIVP